MPPHTAGRGVIMWRALSLSMFGRQAGLGAGRTLALFGRMPSPVIEFGVSKVASGIDMAAAAHGCWLGTERERAACLFCAAQRPRMGTGGREEDKPTRQSQLLYGIRDPR